MPFSMLTMIVPVFITAVGTAYCMHLCDALLENLTKTQSAKDALIHAFTEMFLPTFIAVITTIIGLASLMINRITAIQEFAVFASIGLLSLLFIALTLMPAAFAVLLPLPLTDNEMGRRLTALLTRLLDLITHIDLKNQRHTFIITGTLLVMCTAGIFLIQVETNPMEYFRGDTPVRRHFNDIYRDISGCFPVQVVLESTEEDFFEQPAHIAHITRLQAFLESLPKVDKSISFADYLMLVNYATNRYAPEYYNLPEESFEVRMLINNYKMLLGQDMLTTFMNPDFSKASILLLTHLSSSRDFLDIQEKIRAHVKTKLPGHLSVKVTGIGMVISESSQQLAKGQINSLWMTMGIVFSMMLICYLSARVGIVAILVVSIPTLTTFGIMGWFGIELNMATGLIASIAIGLAEDNTTHYLIRYNREFKKDLDKDRALRDTIASVGRPIVSMTLVICIGFSFLLFSHFVPTAIFGLLMVVTMLAATVGNLILLPSLMLHVELVTVWDMLRLMPSLSGMSADIAHELNQPLNAIKMGSEYLTIMLQQEGRIESQQLFEVAQEIDNQVDRASEIINRLRVFGEKPAFARESVDINRPIQDTVAILKHQLSLENIEIVLNLSPGISPISAHYHRLGQVFYNLIINAGEAIEKRRKIDVSNDSVIHITSYEDAGRVIVTVSDTGIGISDYLRDRVFEPFFTTKETGKGKGLGLSIVHEIVRDYDGRIKIERNNKMGTTCVLSFPV
jgi:signal transduction histidine kinase